MSRKKMIKTLKYCLLSLLFLYLLVNYRDSGKTKLYVVTTIFNPLGYESRYRMYRQFADHMSTFANVRLITVELGYGNQTFQVTEPRNPDHIQLRTDYMLWYKENLINIALRQLPRSCKHVAWVDADIEFLNGNWVEDTLQALKTYKIVQLFQFAHFLGPNSQVLQSDAGFGYYYALNRPYRANWLPCRKFDENGREIEDLKTKNGTACYWHSGYGWAAEKDTLFKMGGLLELGVLGGGDYMMSYAYINRVEDSLALKPNRNFQLEIIRWSRNIQESIQQRVGYVKGDINHFWHGAVENRQYKTRDAILHTGDILFDPKIHLFHDQNNLIKLSQAYKNHVALKIENFYKTRNEDQV